MTAVTDITDEELESFTSAVLLRYGVDFTCYEPKSLKRRIIRTLANHKLNSMHELWAKILSEKEAIQLFMNEVSVGMTSMFRDPELWTFLADYLRKQNPRRLDVWHAGCSTGEEVYSMAILLREIGFTGAYAANATDMNRQALWEAEQGKYHKIKMIENERNFQQVFPNSDIKQYFTWEDQYAVFDPSLRKNVMLGYQNLITDKASGKYDIIFCRNVMIYFDNTAKQRLLESFHKVLKPEGLFIIGFYDTLFSFMDSDKYTLLSEPAKVFIKRG